MTNQRKKPGADLRKSYTVLLEAGLIVALLIMIAVVKVNLKTEMPQPPETEQQDLLQMEDVIQTQQIETPPPPLRPQVPVEVPNDEIIEDEIIDLDAELDLDGPIGLPPAPPPAEEDEEEVFVIVEQMPDLVDGYAALQKSVEYPERARRYGIEGRVTVQFVVNKKGQIEGAHVVRGIGGGCDEEALRAVRNAKFTPGMQRGVPVRVQMALDIIFRLSR